MFENAATMQTLVLRDVLSMRPEEWPRPTPGPGEALVRVLSAGICGSEIHAFHGQHAKRVPPAIMGHEICGIVEALGEGVREALVGTRVVVLPQRACGHCHWCRNEKPNLCDSKTMLGERSWPGGFAECFTTPAELLYPVAEHVPDDIAIFTEPLAVAVHAVRRAALKQGNRVLVIGAGAIGLMTILAAQEAGATMILATDLADYNLECAHAVGATHTLNPTRGDVVVWAQELSSGFGLDVAFMAADAPGLLDQAIACVRKQGHIALIAMFPDARTVNLQSPKAKEQAIIGSLTFTPDDFQASLDILHRRWSDIRSCVTHRFALKDGERAFQLADQRMEDVVRIVLKP